MMLIISPFLKISSAKLKDIETIYKIEQSLYSTPWSEKSFIDLLKTPNFWFWVVKKKKEIVGYLVCQIVEKEAELHNIAVSIPFQHQGIGKWMLEELKEKLIQNGVQNLYLMVRKSNLGAKMLYFSFGFEEVGIRKNYYNDPVEDALLFSLALDKKKLFPHKAL